MAKVFLPLSMTDIARMINSATREVTVAGPGIDEQIAGALVAAAERLGAVNVQVILDVAEENCRAGYGNVLGYSTLTEAGVQIRHTEGLRIGVVVCDEEGFIFATPPLMVEGPELTARCPNAVRASGDQIRALIAATRPRSPVLPYQEQAAEAAPEAKTDEPEIGLSIVPPKVVQSIEKAIEQNPVQDLDLSRVVNVFTAHIQLGELTVTGAQLQNHTVRLPPSLLTIIRDEKTRSRVTAAFKIVAEQSKVSGEHITKKAAEIRKRYFRRHPKFGSIFLKARLSALLTEIEQLRCSLELHKAQVRSHFSKEAAKSKVALSAAFWRAVQKSPPDDLLVQLSSPKPSADEAKAYLLDLLDQAFPDADRLCLDMSVRFVPKDLTWESLNEDGFVEWLAKQYPANTRLQKPFELYRATRARARCSQTPAQNSLKFILEPPA